MMNSSQTIAAQRLPSVCPLSRVDGVKGYGGKAYHLAVMLKRGFPVYPGFVVTDEAFQEFLNTNHLRSEIADLCGGLELNQPGSIQRISSSIRALVLAAELPQHIMTSIIQHWQDLLPGRTLIVRSSAVGEDSKQASFAGQLDSILDVSSHQQLRQALLSCWASYWSERSLFYQLSRGISLKGMGVLIQCQSVSRISGVLFTVSPESNAERRDSMLLEYCQGFGSALVSGQVNPARIAIRRDTRTVRQLAFEESSDDHAPLNPDIVNSLADYGLQLEDLFGAPQDVEWTVDETDCVRLLQSRSISVSADDCRRSSDAMTTTNPPSAGIILWSNANVNENFPEPITPFLYSVASAGYYHYFRNLGTAIGISELRLRAMQDELQHIIGVHGARMYYNLSSIHACLRMAPCGEWLTESFNNFVGADRTAATDGQPDWSRFRRSRMTQFGELCRIGLSTGWRSLWLVRGVTRFEQTVDAFAAATHPELLPHRSLTDLRSYLRQFMDIRCRRWVHASLADAAAMLSYGMLRQFLHREFPDEDLTALHNSLLKGLPELASNQPVIGLWDLSRMIQNDEQLSQLFRDGDSSEILGALELRDDDDPFRARFTAYLEQCGFRCSGELLLTVASFQECPDGLIDILRTYVTLDGESPAERLNEQDRQRQSETRRVLQLLKRRSMFRFLPWPTKAFAANHVLKWTQRSIALRERARLKQALLYSRLRRILLETGRQLATLDLVDEATDVFFLSWQELDELLWGGSMFPEHTRELIRVRKAAHRAMSQLSPPDTFELPEGTYFRSETQLPHTTAEESPAIKSDHESILRGLGACGGTVTANAALLNDVTEFDRLSRGDILVTRQTDPGWGHLFFLIQGLVIERGGMLSHGAILAREYGIPTVVGVPHATREIRHGQRLAVNGDRGTVELLRE